MIKAEMHGTGGGRWTTREDAKEQSRIERRHADRRAVDEQLDSAAEHVPCDGFGCDLCNHDDLDVWFDYALEACVDNRPLTVPLADAWGVR